jgi:hypothetical protein
MATVASLSIQFTDHLLAERGQRAGFLLLAAFLLAFAFIRTSARLMRSPQVPWWPGSVETSSGLHIHHLVWGIVLLLVTGFLAFAIQPGSPWLELLAAGFGVGVGLTLDEFALWLHLEDVYWSAEGRQSLDAVVVAAVFGGLVVLGVSPFDLEDERSIAAIALAVAVIVSLSAIAILKGKLMLGFVGLFVPMFALVGALRLAKPSSPWARWRYRERGDKLASATARLADYEARRERWLDRIGGAASKDL